MAFLRMSDEAIPVVVGDVTEVAHLYALTNHRNVRKSWDPQLDACTINIECIEYIE